MLTDVLAECKQFLNKNVNNKDRRAKIQTADFAIGLLQAVANSASTFSLAELRLSLGEFLGDTIQDSSFNSRLQSTNLQRCLLAIISFLMKRIYHAKAKNNDHERILEELDVKRINGIDSSMVTLWDALSDYFGGTFMEASIKLHFSIDLLTSLVDQFNITAGKVHDSKWFPKIRKGNLYIFDLGYWSIELLKSVESKKAFFLSRLKSNAKVFVNQVIAGQESLAGSNLLQNLQKIKGAKIVELIGTLKADDKEHTVRVIGFWNKKEKHYHWYITNLTCDVSLISELYRLRWQIELSFKAMKSSLSFDRIPTTNQIAATNFVLIAVLNYLFAVLLKLEAEKTIEPGLERNQNASIQKAGKLLGKIAGKLFEPLKICNECVKNILCDLNRLFQLHHQYLFDPNHRRRHSTTSSLARMC